MRFAALVLLSGLVVIGCDREAYKDSNYSKPINQETIQSTSGLDPNARFDAQEPRPPSETPGVKGTSSDDRVRNPDQAVGTNAPPRNSSSK